MPIARNALAVVIAICVAAFAAAAQAQTEEQLERARERFAEGVEHLDAERFAQAVACFRDVLAVRASGQVRYNLAIALQHTGKLAEASRLLAEVPDDRSVPARTRRDARRLLRSIEPRLAHVTISVQGDHDGAVMVLDEEELGLDQVDQSIAVDPGRHVVLLRRGRQILARQQVELSEGESDEVVLAHTGSAIASLPAPGGDDPYALPVEHNRATQANNENVVDQWWFWVAMGSIGVVLLSIVIGVAVSQ